MQDVRTGIMQQAQEDQRDALARDANPYRVMREKMLDGSQLFDDAKPVWTAPPPGVNEETFGILLNIVDMLKTAVPVSEERNVDMLRTRLFAARQRRTA